MDDKPTLSDLEAADRWADGIIASKHPNLGPAEQVKRIASYARAQLFPPPKDKKQEPKT